MTKAAGYIRVSTAGQAEHGLGLDVQREEIEAYCRKQGLQLVAVYEDAGVSGANGIADRRGWPLLAEALEAGEFQVVIIKRLDRLARDLMLQETMLAKVQSAGGELKSIAEPDLCCDDPARTLFRHMIGAIAQYEKAMIVARLRSGRRKKVRQGGYAGGWLPYGYTVSGALSKAVPVIDEVGAAVVRRIFSDYAKGSSMGQIAEGLNSEAVPTVGGGAWTRPAVRAILANEFYTGRVLSDAGEVVREGHPAIISLRQFTACQRRRSEARKRKA